MSPLDQWVCLFSRSSEADDLAEHTVSVFVFHIF